MLQVVQTQYIYLILNSAKKRKIFNTLKKKLGLPVAKF